MHYCYLSHIFWKVNRVRMDLDPFEPGASDFFWWGYISFRHISQSREGDPFRKPWLARCNTTKSAAEGAGRISVRKQLPTSS